MIPQVLDQTKENITNNIQILKDTINKLGFPGGVKNMPAMQETWVWSLSLEDPLEKGMATHSSILACKISWTEEPGGL